MAGHSHWAQIKHKKASADLKKGQIISKLLKGITIAAKEGINPETNSKLRSAIERAKKFQVSLENINKALKKAEAKEENLEEIIFEAYLDEVQILIKAITDNKNRTLGEIRHLLNRYQGRLVEPGSVIWNFQEKGIVVLDKKEQEKILEFIDFYEDLKENGDILLITKVQDLNKLKNKIEDSGIEIKDSYIEFRPINTIEISEEKREKIDKFINEILELEDVDEVFTNLAS